MSEYEDERIAAWHKVADHPFFKKCYSEERPLIEAMMSHLDGYATEKSRGVADKETVEAEEPVDSRLVRAYVNGFREGMERASHGRLDHW